MLTNKNKRKVVVFQMLTLSGLIITICLLRLNAQSENNRRDDSSHQLRNTDSTKIESNKKLSFTKKCLPLSSDGMLII